MARPPRLEIADAIYYVFARGNERRRIFRDDADFRGFLKALDDAVSRYRWRVNFVIRNQQCRACVGGDRDFLGM